ncbi:MAG TPA: NAD-dependent epimerase/dehydratase family protein [Vicinamibacterales bacterium]|nr:NAD-dependent epimerase/dehydratase family protein [Vicinamibacterales bacterium]
MRVLVIGGTKFIGPYVVRELVSLGHDVTVYHRGEHEPSLPRSVRHVHSPAAAMPVVAFSRELHQPPPDVVIHMIAMGERDANAVVDAFRDRAGRLIVLSSGDVYQAYGRLIGLEPGPRAPGLLTESSPVRTMLYPYRKQAQSEDDWIYWYDKILVERSVLAASSLPAVVLRLPKVYGPGENADLGTVYGFRQQPQWRWTHGYVENLAHAIVLAALHPAAAGIYNVGEAHTPTVAERLADLPPSPLQDASTPPFHFEHDIAYDTSRIRRQLGYAEPVGYAEGLRRTLASATR